MSFIFHGTLQAALCGDCVEPVVNGIIRCYRSRGTLADMAALALADPKETLALLTDDHLNAKTASLLAEAKVDDNGSFTLTFGDDYKGEPFEIDVYLEQMPRQKRQVSEPHQFTITTLQPRWKARENDYIAYWDYLIPWRFWCWLRELFDAWVICGHVTVCDNHEQPVSSVRVFAKDADWITDDDLGSDVTDSTGHFRIDYSSIDFKQTFLSPFINVETPFSPYNSGPDVYFRIEASDGTVLLAENRSMGNQPGRANVGPCLCVELCVDVEVGDGNEPVPSVWTNVGAAFIIPDSGGLNDFDADGYAGAAKYAITSTVRMLGSAPRTQNGHNIEYRFLVSNTTATNGGAPVPAANFTRIVGVGANSGLFAPVQVGTLIRLSPFRILPVVAQVSDLDSNGWLDVNNAVARTFTDEGIPPADQPAFLWQDNDALMAINTAGLTTEPNVPPMVADPGQPVPLGDRIAIEKVAVRFEVREVVNKATNTFITLPASGTTLNAMIINNNPMYLKVAMKEHLEGSPCGILTGTVNVAYTVYHPHLQQANVHIRSNDYTINTNLTDAGQGLPLSGNTNPAVDHKNNPALLLNGLLTLHRCTYLVTLTATPRLHTGDGAVSSSIDQTTFFFNV